MYTHEETNWQANNTSTPSSQDASESRSSEMGPTFGIDDKINHEKNGVNSILGALGKQAKPPGHTELEFNSSIPR